MSFNVTTRGHNRVSATLPVTVHDAVKGIMSRLGPYLADWEPVVRSAYCDFGADDYEIAKLRRRATGR
jgi:hypothetical protein